MMTGHFGFHRVWGRKTNKMSESNEFILERAIATRAAQNVITTTWQWEEHTVAAWDADIEEFITQKETITDLESAKTAAAAALDVKLDQLHDRTQISLSLFKGKHRDNPSLTHVLKPLTAEGGSRGAILEEALEFESEWEQWDPGWLPKATWTLVGFKALRQECLSLKEPYASSKGTWRKAVGDYNGMGERLNKLGKAWYEAATTLFKEGTPEGDMIRNTVPTTYNPLPIPAQAQVQLEAQVGTDGMAISYDATDATLFDLYLQSPGNAAFVLRVANRAEKTYTITGLVPGNYVTKVIGKNSRDAGPESEPAGFTIG